MQDDIDVDQVRQLVERALAAARAQTPNAGERLQELHAGRSRAFVRALADTLRLLHEGDVASLCKYDDRDRERIGMRELLHDVTVCRLAEVRSVVQGKTLWYITDALWQVESELARDSRQALIDFNKLVLGSARYKLFVGPQVADPEAFIGVLRPAAARCTGAVFAALIPHPDSWDQAAAEVQAWKLHPRPQSRG